MNRPILYALSAFSTFFLGIGIFSAASHLDSVEGQLADWLVVTPQLEAPTPRPVDAGLIDEQAIYQTVILQALVNDRTEMVVVQAQTTGCPLYENEKLAKEFGHTAEFLSSVRSFMPTVEDAALNDYLDKNKDRTGLLSMDPGIDYILIGPKGISHFFARESGSGWRGFYAKYPKSTGLLFFSRIGFNPQYNQAFLYAGKSCGGLCGFGSYFLLAKQEGKWIIERQQGLWVS